jgi:hypothetical protein
MTTNEILDDILPEGWSHDGLGFDSLLICPHGERVEWDGGCPEGCESPLVEMGMI